MGMTQLKTYQQRITVAFSWTRTLVKSELRAERRAAYKRAVQRLAGKA